MAVFTANPSYDGRVYYVGAGDWATARGAATGTGSDDNNTSNGAPKSSNAFTNVRIFQEFNTSSIPANAIIVSATLALTYVDNGGHVVNTDTTTVEVVKSTAANPLTTAEYDSLVFTSGGSYPFASVVTGNGANVITFNGTGLGFIVKGGTTKLALITGRDLNNQAPTGDNSIDSLMPQDYGTAAARPILTVNYTIPGAIGYFEV